MNTRTTLILALCLVAVASYLVFVAKPWAEPEAAPEAAGPQDIWADKPSVDDITRLEVASTRHAPRVFVREGDQWRLAEPIAARAQKWAVEDMVRSVIDLKADRQYAMNDKNRPANETTHLDAPVYTVTLVTKDDKALTLKVGARTPTGGDTYVQKGKEETILVAGENLHTKFDKKLRDLRDKRVTEFKIEEATRVKVEGMQNYELVKVDDTWRVESPVRCRADKAKVEAMLRAASSLSAEEFITDEPPSLQPYQL
ncbi:MAG: DUF4340 domain-containing protein, partial [Phycisphaerae bacterium]|nr:DUF4340 domain-containing protein [Phycisphaerae bacterium]